MNREQIAEEFMNIDEEFINWVENVVQRLENEVSIDVRVSALWYGPSGMDDSADEPDEKDFIMAVRTVEDLLSLYVLADEWGTHTSEWSWRRDEYMINFETNSIEISVDCPSVDVLVSEIEETAEKNFIRCRVV